jgi:chemotaxis protein MotA
MMGTLMGLIIMLKNMSDVSSIGSGMAVALITTLYGAIMANLLFSPIVRKLEILHNAEILAKQMMLEGILSLIHGENVRLLKDKLAAFLSTELRQKFESESQE